MGEIVIKFKPENNFITRCINREDLMDHTSVNYTYFGANFNRKPLERKMPNAADKGDLCDELIVALKVMKQNILFSIELANSPNVSIEDLKGALVGAGGECQYWIDKAKEKMP